MNAKSLLFLCWVLFSISGVACKNARTAVEGSVDASYVELPSGSVQVTVKLSKSGGEVDGLIRVLAPMEMEDCNPYQGVFRQLDLRDRPVDEVSRSISGPWSISDSDDDEFRVYTAVVSPIRMRQQFAAMAMTPAAATMGAITGGSVAGKVYACLYKSGDALSADGVTADIKVIGSAAVSFVSKSSAEAPLIDASVLVLNPVLPTAAVGSSPSYILNFEAHSSYVGVCPADASVPHLDHVSTKLAGVYIQTQKTGGNTRNQPKEGAEYPECDAVAIGTSGCIECIQRFSAVAPLAPSSDGKLALAALDVLSKFVAGDSDESIFFAHFVIPTGQTENKKEGRAEFAETATQASPNKFAGGSGRVAADVTSGGMLTTQPGSKKRSRSADAAPLEIMTATLFDGRKSCLEFSVDAAAATEATRLFVDEATMTVCRTRAADGVCADEYSASMVHRGKLNSQLVKFGGGILEVKANGITRLCYTPQTGISDCRFDVDWTVKTKVGRSVASARGREERDARGPPPPPEDDDDHHHDDHHEEHDGHHGGHEDVYELAEWCMKMGNCTGVFVIQTMVKCDGQTEYDPIYGRCVSHGAHEARHGARWGWLPLLFIIAVIVFGIIACAAAYHEDHVVSLHTS